MFVLLVGAATGCGKKYPTATQIQTTRMDDTRCVAMAHLDDMADNAILQDMSLADFHFAGRSSELSSTGEARLQRMAHLLKHYSGTITYDTSITDKALVEQRLSHVRDYLKLVGVDMSRVTVEVGIPGGRTTAADRAIAIQKRGTSAKGSASGGSMVPVMTAPAGGAGN